MLLLYPLPVGRATDGSGMFRADRKCDWSKPDRNRLHASHELKGASRTDRKRDWSKPDRNRLHASHAAKT